MNNLGLKLQNLLLSFAKKEWSKFIRISFAVMMMLIFLSLDYFLAKKFNIYAPIFLILATIVTTVVAGPFFGITITLIVGFLFDYIIVGSFLIKNVYEKLVIFPTTAIMAILAYLLQSQMLDAYNEKQQADKEKQIAFEAKVIADKEKQIALEAKVKASKALKQRDEMVGVVSHELKNPITSLLLNIELLQRSLPKEPGMEKTREMIGKLISPIKRMNRLVSDLLEMTRIEANELRVEMNTASLDEITLEVFDMFNAELKEKNIQLTADIPPDCQEVFCDKLRTIQILSNLVGNASKFTANGGSISISAKKIENMAEVCVADNGMGIREEYLPHVFERFWQEKNTAHIGTGLGLTIVKGLVEVQGGKIWVISHYGAGTKFYFTLKLAEKENQLFYPHKDEVFHKVNSIEESIHEIKH
jgi:signal transduction histidine kinase